MAFDSDNVVEYIDAFLKKQYQKLDKEKKILHEILNFLKKNGDSLNDELGQFHREFERPENANPSGVRQTRENDHLEAMVRHGEFSPLNPAFRSNDKPLLGLGEYEERRKRFLAKKKREYLQYLTNAKNEKEKQKRKEVTTSGADDEKENVSKFDCTESAQKTGRMFQEIFSPKKEFTEGTDCCYKRWQQEAYKRELDKQITEKRKRLDEEKLRERNEYEKKIQEDMMLRYSKFLESPNDQSRHHQNLNNNAVVDANTSVFEIQPPLRRDDNARVKYISNGKSPSLWELRKAVHRTNFNRASNDQFRESQSLDESDVNPPIDYATEQEFNKLSLIPSRITTTHEMKHSLISETKPDSKITPGQIPDSKTNQKMQQDHYKNDLALQIEEKNRLKMERKIKEGKEEEKLERKAKHEREKLRKEFEKERAEVAYYAAQKVQQELRHQEFLDKIHEKSSEPKKNLEQGSVITPSRALVHLTKHRGFIGEKGITKKVYFSVDHFNNNQIENSGVEPKANSKFDSDLIIDAPYTLAIEGNLRCKNAVALDGPKRSPSPPVPAITTKKLLKSLPKIEDIPSTVSMSEETKKQFFNDSTILSSLPEIRRKLLEKQISLNSK